MAHTAIIMAAPNGARKTKNDHPNLAVTIEETVEEAARCSAAGASILHAHVRGEQGQHVLDANLYQKLFNQMTSTVPEMLLQMTTEAVGVYSAEQQAQCVFDLGPPLISISVREMAGVDKNLDHARNFYHWNRDQNVHMQHIVYDESDLDRLLSLQHQGILPAGRLCVLFVLGRFLENREAEPDDIAPFLSVTRGEPVDWFVCAFGRNEHACALEAVKQSGHARVGFENNLLLPNGNTARYTADLVEKLRQDIELLDISVANAADAKAILDIKN